MTARTICDGRTRGQHRSDRLLSVMSDRRQRQADAEAGAVAGGRDQVHAAVHPPYDRPADRQAEAGAGGPWPLAGSGPRELREPIGSASCRERVCPSVSLSVGAVTFTKKTKHTE